MARLVRDDNRVVVAGAVTNDSDLTPTAIRINAATNGMLTDQTILTPNSSMDHGAKSSIGATALQLTATTFACKIGVLVVAKDDNAGNIYVGNSDVTAGSAAATDGSLVEAGRHVVVDIDDPTDLYVIADSGTGNKVFYLAI